MLFDFLKKKRQEKADDQQHWRERWQSLVPEENRSVPVTVDGQTRIAYIQINQFCRHAAGRASDESAFF